MVDAFVSQAVFDALALRVTAIEAAIKVLGAAGLPSPPIVPAPAPVLVPVPATVIALAWKLPVPPAEGAVLVVTQGKLTYAFAGALLENVEISVGGKLLSTATCSADGTTASGIVDLSTIPVGTATLVADAWNAPPGQATTGTQHTHASINVLVTA